MVFTVFNAVIKVDNGVIKEIVWDNDCYDCFYDDNVCFEDLQVPYMYNATNFGIYKNCKEPKLCKTSKNEAFKCDPKFYITWYGTDVKGRRFQSSGMAMSRFRQYSVGSLYRGTSLAFNSTIQTLQNNWNELAVSTSAIAEENNRP